MTKKELLKQMQQLSIEPRYHFITRELIGVAVDYIPTLRYKSRMIEIEIFIAKHKYDIFSL